MGPGTKLLETAGVEFGSIFLLLVIAISVLMFYKRDFSKFLGFALFSLVVGVFIFEPKIITSMGSDGFKWLFESYLR